MPQIYPIETIRHSLAHVMAAAIKHLYGDKVQFGIGPVIENGFYYDFDFTNAGEVKLSPDDFSKIETEMRAIIKKNLDFARSEMPIADAVKKFTDASQSYKAELLKDLQTRGTTKIVSQEEMADIGESVETVSLYQTGDFYDLCRGPHVANTSDLTSHFKLMSVAGAYWRGDEKNPMMQRIYAIAFGTMEELEKYLYILEEAQKRDHRKLGQELDLFTFHEENPGCPFWYHKGMMMRNLLVSQLRAFLINEEDYQEIAAPLILNKNAYITSGHWGHYKENIFVTTAEGDEFGIKPMNCPGSILIYKSRQHSYRELPLRFAEFGMIHRNERSGTLHGLLRVREFTQDDAHIYLQKNQIADEFKRLIRLTDKILNGWFHLKYQAKLSTRPDDFMGDIADWNEAEATLEKVLKENGVDYVINPKDGAFYGPKIDIHIEDSLGRTWQCTTLQLDMQQPKNFALEYTNQKGEKEQPVMIHRTILGSIERFMGILIEHYAGAFPLWLAPVQIKIIPVSDKHIEHSRALSEELKKAGFRVEIDEASESVGKKIHAAEKMKVPYMLVIGDKEASGETIVVRKRGDKETFDLSKEEFINRIKKEVDDKKL